jgi:glycosyltransferase involved in cell wall biosynthesis
MEPSIAVLLPCRNEAQSIAAVVRGFRTALPGATVYVYDNASTDDTARVAREAGAVVRFENQRGKGNVVRRMFADVDADVYVIADGDGTYDAAAAPRLIARLLEDRLDMAVAARGGDAAAFRRGHRTGNVAINRFVAWLFRQRVVDMLSGYRALSRRFVKSFPALATGFEIETELTIHALELRMSFAEVPVPYAARPEGSHSKLSTWKDGLRILAAIVFLFKEVRPFRFFGTLCLGLAAISLALAYPLVVTYLQTGLVPRLPTAVLTTGVMLAAIFCLLCGTILDTVSRGRREAKRMRYLAIPAPAAGYRPAQAGSAPRASAG